VDVGGVEVILKKGRVGFQRERERERDENSGLRGTPLSYIGCATASNNRMEVECKGNEPTERRAYVSERRSRTRKMTKSLNEFLFAQKAKDLITWPRTRRRHDRPEVETATVSCVTCPIIWPLQACLLVRLDSCSWRIFSRRVTSKVQL
jgi:hypothetical protein